MRTTSGFVLAGIVVLAGLSSGCGVGASTPDEQFSAAVSDRPALHTTHVPSRQVVQDLGRGLCRALDRGVPRDMLIENIVDQPTYDAEDAVVLMDAATTSYCPEHDTA